MYILYLYSFGFICFVLYKCLSKYNKKKYTKLDYKNNYVFILKSIEFFTKDKKIETKNYNKNYFNQFNFELNVDYMCDYYVVNYIYNNTKYKYYSSNNNLLSFPFYKAEEIKNYVYINKISKALLIIYDKNKENKENEEKIENENEEYDILDEIVKFVGPNYNFYKDLDIKFNIDSFLKYIYVDNDMMFKKLNFIDKNYYIKLYDNFNNEYKYNLDYLQWNPELKL